MNLRRIAPVLAMVVLLGGGAAFLVLRPQAVPLRIADAVGVPLLGEDRALRVFLTLHNAGGADRLIGATSSVAERVDLVNGAPDITVPAHSAPILAADGAHLRMEGVPVLGDGALLPLTLIFASGARVSSRAVLSDPIRRGEAGEIGLSSLGGICRVGDGEPAPTLDLDVAADGDGWRVQVASREFTFSEPVAGMGHVPGYGHGHLYLNGVKLQRMYAPAARIGALPPGDHRVEVTLNTNDHRAYVVDDRPVTAMVDLHVP